MGLIAMYKFSWLAILNTPKIKSLPLMKSCEFAWRKFTVLKSCCENKVSAWKLFLVQFYIFVFNFGMHRFSEKRFSLFDSWSSKLMQNYWSNKIVGNCSGFTKNKLLYPFDLPHLLTNTLEPSQFGKLRAQTSLNLQSFIKFCPPTL